MSPNRSLIHSLAALALAAICPAVAVAQQVPSAQESLPYLVTFGPAADRAWGDDDFSQTLFFAVPKSQGEPFYIRIFDPETFGELDENKKGWDTKMKYSVYGGKDAYSDKDARSADPSGNYKSGVLIDSRIFGSEKVTDQQWVALGPFNPTQGEEVADLDAYVFKVVAEGTKGDDGNLYKLFLSGKSGENLPVPGARSFAYEYSLRLPNAAGSVAHLYPFAGQADSLFIRSFDLDHDALLRLYSPVKNGHEVSVSGNNVWSTSKHAVGAEEKNRSLDLQIVCKTGGISDMVICITGPDGVPLPCFSPPAGGVPKYQYRINIGTAAKAR